MSLATAKAARQAAENLERLEKFGERAHTVSGSIVQLARDYGAFRATLDAEDQLAADDEFRTEANDARSKILGLPPDVRAIVESYLATLAGISTDNEEPAESQQSATAAE